MNVRTKSAKDSQKQIRRSYYSALRAGDVAGAKAALKALTPGSIIIAIGGAIPLTVKIFFERCVARITRGTASNWPGYSALFPEYITAQIDAAILKIAGTGMVNPFRKATVTVTGRHGSADIPLPAPMLQCVSDARLRAQVLEIARKDYREQSVGGVTVPELCRRWSLHEACVEGHPFFVGVRLAIYVALSKSKDVNFLISGRTLLWTAIRYGHYNLIRILLRVGVDPNISDGYGRTPLHLASKAGSADSIRILLDAGVDPNVQDEDRVTPLHLASEAGSADSIKILLDAGAGPKTLDSRAQTPLHLASKAGSADSIRILLDAGVDPNIQNKDGETPLQLASEAGSADSIRMLLDAGAGPKTLDSLGRTPLHLASKAGSADSIRILLDAGVEPNVQDNDEVTPLHFAVTHLGSEQGALEAAKLLLEAGADPSLKTNKGACAISVAVARGWDDMIELFRGRCPEQVAGYWFDAA